MAGELASYRGADVQGPDWAFDAVALEQTAVESAEIRADEGDEGAGVDDASSLFNDWIVRADDRQGLLDFYRAVAIRLLDEHWPAINAVARALTVRRLLDQHALTEMLGEQTAPWWNR